ncbi:carbohydrate kinase family protein [Natrialba taiwanensis]|uniref:PfkB domain-containing protein n=1 Tax=Natrialba taiwanensis DSM 12281 TaxID=1230458 RepID=L9ZR07_9EURY|nr:PfkB family carbohydrate kinase [Natrialba taiwanensis]ELY88799.1 PfkB domain-containing protein [Natrialba taiwanensis DSM 12281]
MVRVLTAGHVNWDVTLRVDRLPEADCEAAIRSQHQSGGGSAGNVATALATLAVDTGLIGSVGDDDNGLLASRELEAAGVTLDGLRVVDGAETAVKYLLVDDDGEVAVLGNDGINEAVTPADLDRERIRTADHVHLTSQRPDTAAAIACTATEAGLTVSFDPGRRLGDRDYTDALAAADIVFANDREIAALLEDEYVGSDFDDRIVAVKYGGDGAEVHTPAGSYVHPGFDVETVDTAGAGDAFAAGFIATLLDRVDTLATLTADSTPELEAESNIERALEFANACGALTASQEGARSAPTRPAVEGFLRTRF